MIFYVYLKIIKIAYNCYRKKKSNLDKYIKQIINAVF